MALYIEEHGHGPPLVLLHGWGLHGGVWHNMIPLLAADFHLIIPDLPGHGHSQRVAEDYAPTDYTLETLADMVADGVRSRIPNGAIWLGWSLGALVTLMALQRHPNLVMRAVLVSATPKFMQAADWPYGMDPVVLAQFSTSLAYNYRSTLLRFLSLQVGLGADLRQTAKALREIMLARAQPQTVAIQAGLTILRASDLRSMLAQITLPVRLLHGGRDKLVPVAAAQIMAEEINHSRLQILSTAGHAPFISHPEEFMRGLKSFLYD